MQTNQLNTEAIPRGSIHSFKGAIKSAYYNTENSTPVVIEEVKQELEGNLLN